jgi:hypothetical protein
MPVGQPWSRSPSAGISPIADEPLVKTDRQVSRHHFPGLLDHIIAADLDSTDAWTNR